MVRGRGSRVSAGTLRRRLVAVLGLVTVLVVGAVAAGCGASRTSGPSDGDSPTKGAGTEDTGADAASAATRISEGGEVTVEVTWEGESAGPSFDVTMDTHSVDLDGYDLKKLAVLRNDRGQEVRATGWGAPKGGHHREGTLRFPEKTAGGEALIGPDTRKIELVIRDVAGMPERSFEWNL